MMNFEEVPAGSGDGEGAPPPPPPLEEKSVEEQKKMEETILAEKEELGVYDSDEDNERRLRQMRNPEMRKFNVNDILGDFERDEKGNLVMLQNKAG
mmetsp:Transcript_22223/g.16646  ORF Transcript_22223/g.16646 Transcript_22223/m.16646 type:complete len:96 (+) Transcript_22223:172-459(+)